MNSIDRLIVALDFPNHKEALSLVDTLGELVGFYKVGSELFSASGKQIISSLKERGKKVFLDLKFFDIPTTVERTCAVLAEFGVDMIDVHCLGGRKMMEAAVRGTSLLKRAGPGADKGEKSLARREDRSESYADRAATKVIGVTLLTSFDDETSGSLFRGKDRGELSVRLAVSAKESRLHGVVCASSFVRRIKEVCGTDFLTVVPGIRPRVESRMTEKSNEAEDHTIASTPKEAFMMGADFIVIGRPISRSPDPRSAVLSLAQSSE